MTDAPSQAINVDQMVQPLGSSGSEAMTYDRTEDTQITQYLGVLRRRKWVVAIVLILAVLAAIAYTLSATPLYRATTTLQIQRESARVVDIDDLQPQSSVSGSEFYQTQYGLLQSRSVALETARKLRLADNAGFLGGYGGSADASLMNLPRQKRLEMAVGLVEAYIVVAPVRNSGLVEVNFDSPDGQLAAQIANATAEAFIALNLQRRFDATADAREFLERELAKTRVALEESERDVVDFAGNQELIEINRVRDAEGNTSGESLSEIDLDALNRALATAKADRIEAQAKLSASRASGASSEAITDQTLGQIRTELAKLEAQYAKDLATFRPEYPAMIALNQQIKSLQSAVSARGSSIGNSLQASFRAASARESALQAQVNSLKSDVLGQSRKRIQYNIFKRDADTNRALYESLLERYKQIGVAGGVGVNNVAVVDEARIPGSPYTPNLIANLLLALVAGLITGVGLAFILDQLDDAIKTPADIEKLLGTPLLGVVPKVNLDDPVDQLADRTSPLSESYLAIQTSLNFSTNEGVPKVLVVTSANPSEGKSTTAFSIAATLARLGKNILIVDADMRNPSLHHLIESDNRHGLVELLTDNAKLDDVIRPTSFDNMSAITSGPIPPNPAELLTGAPLKLLINQLSPMYDHIIVDSPPVLGLSDAPLIANVIRETVFVISANATSSKSAIGSLRRLMEGQAHIIGAVLTKFDSADHGYSYNYEYKYGVKKSIFN